MKNHWSMLFIALLVAACGTSSKTSKEAAETGEGTDSKPDAVADARFPEQSVDAADGSTDAIAADTTAKCAIGPAGAYLPRDEYCALYHCPESLDAMFVGYDTCEEGNTVDPSCFAGCPLTVYSGCGLTVVNPHIYYFNEYYFDTTTGELIGAETADDIPSGTCNSFGYYWGVATQQWETDPLPFECATMTISTCRPMIADGG